MAQAPKPAVERAVRGVARGTVQGVGMREAVVERARGLGVSGWIRHGESGEVLLHLEGAGAEIEDLLEFVRASPAGSSVDHLEAEAVDPEGHEQFAVRGVDAGRFEIVERERGYELRLEVEGKMRVWALPKPPSMDPAGKRMAFEADGSGSGGGEDLWDGGGYEQGGRVAWPEAIERGHAVFVLNGERLRGGFALQRIREGSKSQWLLIKRRDALAQRDAEVAAG